MAKAPIKQTTATGVAGNVETNTAALSVSSAKNALAPGKRKSETATALNYCGVNGLTPDMVLGYLVSTHPNLKGFSVYIPTDNGEIKVAVTNTIMSYAAHWQNSKHKINGISKNTTTTR